MIPKIIHYCWFGRGPMPELALYCIESWKKFLPDYELRLWNEDTFDVNAVPYVREAYKVRKFAFVTDYVRLWALDKFGGIYMDTDVEVLKPLDDFLELPAFTGYERATNDVCCPVTGIMASESGGVWVREQLAYYKKRHFIRIDGTMDVTPNTQIITSIMQMNGFLADGMYGVYKENMHVFPSDYFCPKRWDTKEMIMTENTYCIHHFSGSWKVNTTDYRKTPLQRCVSFVKHCWRWGMKRVKKLIKANTNG